MKHNKIYQRAIAKSLQDLSESIGQIKLLSEYPPKWSEPKPMFEKTGKVYKNGIPSGTIGVYKIIHINHYKKIMYIGVGNNITGRISRHRNVFLNGGKDIENPGGTTNPSPAAQNMYKYDTNKDKWYFSWCAIANRKLSGVYETLLMNEYNPKFNDKSLGGI